MGQQAIVLCISPSKPNPVFKVFGAAPLENVVGVSRKSYVINCSPSLQVSFCSRQPCKPGRDLKVMFKTLEMELEECRDMRVALRSCPLYEWVA